MRHFCLNCFVLDSEYSAKIQCHKCHVHDEYGAVQSLAANIYSPIILTICIVCVEIKVCNQLTIERLSKEILWANVIVDKHVKSW